MSAIIRDIPDLPGACCKGRADLFEATASRISAPTREARSILSANRDTARAVAFRICDSCPSLPACRTWVGSMRPTRRPRGVIAGQLVDSTGNVRCGLRRTAAEPIDRVGP